jgi:glycerophosphoryl diester phosphodiesterase
MPVRTFEDVPALCGHRGLGRGVVDGHAENTLPSFRAAVAAGFGWVEVDARFTADDVLVSRHDAVVDDGRFVSELTAAQTDELGLMRVADLLEDLPPAIGVDVDVKTSLEDALRPRERTTGALVAELLARERGRRPLLATTFDAGAAAILREGLPDVPVGLLGWGGFPLRKLIPAAVHLGADVVAPHVTSFGLRTDGPIRGERAIADALRVAHEAGLQVVAWCPTLDELDVLLAAGVDGAVVDDVPQVAAARSRRPRGRIL